MEDFLQIKNTLIKSVEEDDFVKITLSKPLSKQNELQNIYIRPIKIKGEDVFTFTYRYKTKDQTKNYGLSDTLDIIKEQLLNNFRQLTLFTLKEDHLFLISKKKKISSRSTPPSFKNKLPTSHDVIKEKRAEKSNYLHYLGIIDTNGKMIPKMAAKYKQINKYLEIIDNQIKDLDLSKQFCVVDMGSGKGYLTFALYDFLKNKKGLNPKITGIELRSHLVNYCNTIAKKCEFENLIFECKPIEDFTTDEIDILIALHACDTATDDAIYKGIISKSQLIITAPCCHKQIRKQIKGTTTNDPILKYGIYKERQYEMVTDTLRALILEKENYQTNIFEFISNEHTRKNIMLIGKRSSKKKDISLVSTKITQLKEQYHIKEHYLESLLT